MKQDFLASLLHLSDPTLPIGAYTHSNGLETYIQNKIVHDKKTAQEFVENMVQYNLKYNDGVFVKLAYEATQNNDLSEILKLDEECSALKAPKEIRQASRKLGLRLIKIFKRRVDSDLVKEFELKVKQNEANSNYAIVYGIYASLLNIPLFETLFSFYYTSVSGIVTNAVKLVPLGQLDGQDILFDLYQLIEKTAEETIELNRDYVGLCNTSFDIRCMQHERLYSRLYMS
ncbi:urease accessory protein UreF [Chishuiella sp.]|uniref:urease accessory protein UreF n=1 Tax=Chishuiella sp. TaxID=1969467 RepID=UPI0028A96834|nr:urease accessory protein UreF [Chishuiella sp.]